MVVAAPVAIKNRQILSLYFGFADVVGNCEDPSGDVGGGA